MHIDPPIRFALPQPTAGSVRALQRAVEINAFETITAVINHGSDTGNDSIAISSDHPVPETLHMAVSATALLVARVAVTRKMVSADAAITFSVSPTTSLLTGTKGDKIVTLTLV